LRTCWCRQPIREGQIVRGEEYYDKDEALEAVGLRE
jgi:hypothetical protein